MDLYANCIIIFLFYIIKGVGNRWSIKGDFAGG